MGAGHGVNWVRDGYTQGCGAESHASGVAAGTGVVAIGGKWLSAFDGCEDLVREGRHHTVLVVAGEPAPLGEDPFDVVRGSPLRDHPRQEPCFVGLRADVL